MNHRHSFNQLFIIVLFLSLMLCNGCMLSYSQQSSKPAESYYRNNHDSNNNDSYHLRLNLDFYENEIHILQAEVSQGICPKPIPVHPPPRIPKDPGHPFGPNGVRGILEDGTELFNTIELSNNTVTFGSVCVPYTDDLKAIEIFRSDRISTISRYITLNEIFGE